MNGMATNMELAKFGGHVMDVISHYDHLPALEFVIVNEQASRVVVSLAHRTNEEQVRGVAEWVAAFETNRTSRLAITLDTVSGRVKARVPVQDVLVRFDEAVDLTFAVDLANAMGTPFPQVAVTADQLLAGLSVLSATREVA